MKCSRRQDDARLPATIGEGAEQSTQERENTSGSPLGSVIGLGAVALVVLIAALVWPRGEQARASTATAVPTTMAPTIVPATAVPPTSTPSGPDIAPYVALIEAHISGGRYREAVTTAEGALTIAGLRADDRTTLTRYVITSGMKELFTQPFNPTDRAQHQRMVNTYLSLRARSAGAGVAIDTPLQVASTAFASSQFQLARVALEEALEEGSFTPEIDRDVTRTYVSTLYGLGKWYTTAEQETPLYEEGLRWLVASERVALKYKTGQSEAAMLLAELVSTDEAHWPSPAAVPLLP